ncbi:hypothetical protein [uncultured Phascolarctobacterium sp.]|nr:hypothetical protein [uncultured Phascolarctobacterium sp.]
MGNAKNPGDKQREGDKQKNSGSAEPLLILLSCVKLYKIFPVFIT